MSAAGAFRRTDLIPKSDETTPIDPLRDFKWFEESPGNENEPLAEAAPKASAPGDATSVPSSPGQLTAFEIEWLHRTQATLPKVEVEDLPVLTPGERVETYLAAGLLGAGGFGEVYAALDTRTRTEVALKFLKRQHRHRKDVAARFAEEGESLKRLRKVPDIVQVFDVAEHNEHGVYIVMERLRGQPLDKHLHQLGGRLPLAYGLDILITVASTMSVVSGYDIVHRDLKPENIVIEQRADGTVRPVILDLGCAKTPTGTKTSSGIGFIGTPAYASPEQCGRGDLSARSDMYGLGAIGYQIFEGKRVFDEIQAALEKQGKTVTLIMQWQWPIVARIPLPEHIPTALWNILCRALEKDPDLRYQTMLEFAAALTRFRAALKTHALDVDDWTPARKGGPKVRPAPQPLPLLPPGEDSRVPNIRPREVPLEEYVDTPSLVVVDGRFDLIGKRFSIGRHVVIGRSGAPQATDDDLLFPLANVSGHHCRLQITLEGLAKGTYQVDDLASLNGIEVGGAKAHEGLIGPGTTLRVGPELEFVLVAPGTVPFEVALQARPRRRPHLANSLSGRRRDVEDRVAESVESVRSVLRQSEAGLAPAAEAPVGGAKAASKRTLGGIDIAIGVALLALVMGLGWFGFMIWAERSSEHPALPSIASVIAPAAPPTALTETEATVTAPPGVPGTATAPSALASGPQSSASSTAPQPSTGLRTVLTFAPARDQPPVSVAEAPSTPTPATSAPPAPSTPPHLPFGLPPPAPSTPPHRPFGGGADFGRPSSSDPPVPPKFQ